MKDVKHFVTISYFKHDHKPLKEDRGYISNQVRNLIEIDVNNFAEIVAQPYGATFCPVNFSGRTRSNKNFVSQSIFCLDFDTGITPEQVIRRFKSYGITPNLYYTTFSDSQATRKFRVVMFLDTAIKDVNQRKYLVDSLLKFFPEADKACKDASRMFFGGNTSTIISQENIPIQKLIEVLDINNISNDGNKLRSIKKSENLNMWSKMITPLYNNKGITNFNHKYDTNSFDFDKVINTIQILNDFANGKWLHHQQLLGIATNLIWVKGGVKWMKEIMDKFNIENKDKYQEGEHMQYNQDNFNIIPYVKKREYNPMALVNFSPYEQDHQYANIITAITNKRGLIEITEPISRISLNEAEKQFEDKFLDSIQADDNNIYIFRLPTGIGKTQALTKVDYRSLISVPTHQLKEEVRQRISYDCFTTPVFPDLEDEKLKKKIEYLYSIGAPKKVYGILESIVNDISHQQHRKDDVEKVRDYLYTTRKLYDLDESTVITTHQRALLNKFKQHTIIFYEDPIDSLFITKSFSLSELFKLCFNSPSEIMDIAINLSKEESNVIHKTKQYAIDSEKLTDTALSIGIETNVLDFFESDYYMRDSVDKNLFHYIIKRILPEDKKIIIMSASIPINIYKKLYGDRIRIIDISDVELKGKIIQNALRSYSRESLQHDIDSIVKKVGDLYVITFMKYKHHFQNPVNEMHFGNTSGYDELKGKNLAVVGTPHQPRYKYLLLASSLGIDYKNADTQLSFQKIDWNGFRFMFNSFESKELQAIQLSLIESELIQAVGRNRTLREDVKTFLYSNLPLRLVNEFENEIVELQMTG